MKIWFSDWQSVDLDDTFKEKKSRLDQDSNPGPGENLFSLKLAFMTFRRPIGKPDFHY